MNRCKLVKSRLGSHTAAVSHASIVDEEVGEGEKEDEKVGVGGSSEVGVAVGGSSGSTIGDGDSVAEDTA